MDRTKILAGHIVVKHTPLKNQRKGSSGADYGFFLFLFGDNFFFFLKGRQMKILIGQKMLVFVKIRIWECQLHPACYFSN